MVKQLEAQQIEIISYRPQAGDVVVLRTKFQPSDRAVESFRQSVKREVGEGVGVFVLGPDIELTVMRREDS